MKTKSSVEKAWHGVLLLGSMLALCQCGMAHSVDRTNGEAWNEGVVWKPRAHGGKDFVPTDFAGALQDGSGKGQWVMDPQDGYRFYVPESGTKRFPKGVLLAEAQKATNRLTTSQQKTTNTVKTVFFPVLATATLFTPDFWYTPGGGGGYADTSSYTDTGNSSGCCDHGHGGDCHSSGGGGGGGGGGHGK